MPRSLPFISLGGKKKGASLQKSICKRSHRTAQHFAVSFSFRTALRLSRLLPSSRSLSLTISRPRLSSSRAILIRQTGPVLLSKAATVSSYQPVTSYLSFHLLFREEETELQWNHGPVDSQHKKIIENRKKKSGKFSCRPVSTVFSIQSASAPGGVHRFVTGPWSISGSH